MSGNDTEYLKGNEIISRINFDKYREFLNEVDLEIEKSSDRSIAIFLVSIIDDLLNSLLQKRVVQDTGEIRKTFSVNSNGVLSTLNSKVEIAYLFGLISKIEKENINIMGTVRNKFGHLSSNIDFDHEKVNGVINNFKLPDKTFVPEKINLGTGKNKNVETMCKESFKKNSNKEKFIIIFHNIFFRLSNRIYATKPIDEKRHILNFEVIEEYILFLKNLRDSAKEESYKDGLSTLIKSEESMIIALKELNNR